MCLLFSLFPMTFWLIMAYFVFFLARRSEGKAKVLGRALGLWILGLAAAVLLLGIYVQFFVGCPLERRVGQILSGRQDHPTYLIQKPGAARRSF